MSKRSYSNIRSERAKSTWAARKARPDYKQTAAFLNLRKMDEANMRKKRLAEVLQQRIQVLVKFAKDFPEGFRYKDIKGILHTAGLEFPPSEKWIKRLVCPRGPFTKVNRFYVLQA